MPSTQKPAGRRRRAGKTEHISLTASKERRKQVRDLVRMAEDEAKDGRQFSISEAYDAFAAIVLETPSLTLQWISRMLRG